MCSVHGMCICVCVRVSVGDLYLCSLLLLLFLHFAPRLMLQLFVCLFVNSFVAICFFVQSRDSALLANFDYLSIIYFNCDIMQRIHRKLESKDSFYCYSIFSMKICFIVMIPR